MAPKQYLIEENLECGGDGAAARGEVHARGVRVEALAEDDPVEGPVKLDVHPHTRLLTLHLHRFHD